MKPEPLRSEFGIDYQLRTKKLLANRPWRATGRRGPVRLDAHRGAAVAFLCRNAQIAFVNSREQSWHRSREKKGSFMAELRERLSNVQFDPQFGQAKPDLRGCISRYPLA